MKYYVKENAPLIQFTDDDQAAVYLNNETQQIEVFQTNKFNEVFNAFPINYVDVVSISPKKTQENFIIASFAQQHNVGYEKTDGWINIYNSNKKNPILTKQVEQAQEIQPYWSPDGNYVIIATESFVDTKNESYYGEQRLLYFNTLTQEIKSVPTYKGPIHDISWSSNNKHFIVISGFMPSATVLFNQKCEPEFEFGIVHRNTVKWSPHNRFVIIAGFGNISGEIDIWDVLSKKQVGYCKSSSAINCVWSHDSRKVMWAPLSDVSIYPDRPASAPYVEQKIEVEEKKAFRAIGSGMFAATLKFQREENSGTRVLSQNQTFNQEVQKPQLQPGQVLVEEKPKQKRIRQKKTTNTQDKGGDEGDSEQDNDQPKK